MNLKLCLVSLITFLLCAPAGAGNFDFRSNNQLAPGDYLFGSHGSQRDPIFDEYRTIDLNLDVGVTSDCGRIDLKSTFKGALNNVLNEKYLAGMGKDILAASPMLLVSYFSPTWASILRHSRIRANFLGQLRMDQCKAINRFVDQRVSDYYEERSKCVQNSIREHGGNFEDAMESCKNYKDYNISSWSGDGKSIENKLIDSTAKWAGFKGKGADRVVDLTKAFIGDTVIKQGNVSVDFGPRRVQLTPRTYFMEVKGKTYQKLCQGLLSKVLRSGGIKSNVYRLISDSDLTDINGPKKSLLDRQTILSLTYLPYKKRQAACRKLSDALAMSIYSDDMGKTLDFISSKMTTNPHLPSKRKHEADQKRRVFKDQVELTLALEEQNSEPLNKVLYQINSEGQKYMGVASKRAMDSETESHRASRIDNIFFDCGGSANCEF